MPNTYPADSSATSAAATLAKCRAVHAATGDELTAARTDVARLEALAPPLFDADDAARALSKARAADVVHGTTAAAELERQQAAASAASGKAEAAHAARLAAAREFVTSKRIALEGIERVMADAMISSKAATAAAARSALAAARDRYRQGVATMLGLVSDIAALETLSQLEHWPESRALDVRTVEVTVPALGAFRFADHAALAEVGAAFNPAPSDSVRLGGDRVRVLALADLRDIRGALEGVAA